ncbi:hypothetical protein [Serratia entomophila]|uniref:hypothetical protein n=2 Tax=Serratia entomophila TaxID=42906 RepID=UPI0021BA6049|nr:hypothetical protein [Serratia entomophila]
MGNLSFPKLLSKYYKSRFIATGVLSTQEGKPMFIQQRFSKVYELLSEEYEKFTSPLCVIGLFSLYGSVFYFLMPLGRISMWVSMADFPLGAALRKVVLMAPARRMH